MANGSKGIESLFGWPMALALAVVDLVVLWILARRGADAADPIILALAIVPVVILTGVLGVIVGGMRRREHSATTGLQELPRTLALNHDSEPRRSFRRPPSGLRWPGYYPWPGGRPFLLLCGCDFCPAKAYSLRRSHELSLEG
jgi:hypothetical protein